MSGYPKKAQEQLLYGIYSLLWYLATPFIALYLLWRSRKQVEYRQHWSERWGFYTLKYQQPLIWVHAVSVGETQAAQPFIELLLTKYPHYQILLTHMTPTGRAAGARLFGKRVLQCYLAYDYRCASARFFQHFKPVIGIILETEVWPNLISQGQKQGIPIVLVNARLSEKSARQAQRYANLMRITFQKLKMIAAQTTDDAARLCKFTDINIVVTGNMKFDVTPNAQQRMQGLQWYKLFKGESIEQQRPIFLAASTREGEEALLLDEIAFLDKPTLCVIVPRHPQRFEEIAQLLKQRDIAFIRRSQWDQQSAIPAEIAVLLGDSMGEMPAYYAACDLAFIGGSLVPVGGQNLIEACALGKPVLIGPYTFNFSQASREAVNQGAAKRIQNPQELIIQVNQLFQQPAELQMMATAAFQYSAQHRGATQKTLQILRPLLKNATPTLQNRASE